jgi:hypothetical protein
MMRNLQLHVAGGWGYHFSVDLLAFMQLKVQQTLNMWLLPVITSAILQQQSQLPASHPLAAIVRRWPCCAGHRHLLRLFKAL